MKKTAKIFLLPALLIALATTLTSCDPDHDEPDEPDYPLNLIVDYTRVLLVNENTRDSIIVKDRNDPRTSQPNNPEYTTTSKNEIDYLTLRNGDRLSMQCIDLREEINYDIAYFALNDTIEISNYPYKVEFEVSNIPPGMYDVTVFGWSEHVITTDQDGKYYNTSYVFTFAETNILNVIE